MTREEKKCCLAETIDIRPSTASIAVDMLEQQEMFIAAIARNEYNRGVIDALEIIEKANDENRNHVGVVQNDDMDKAYSIIWERVNELMKGVIKCYT